MRPIIDAILSTQIIAVVRLPRYDHALAVAQALLEGGISAIEFTLTGSNAVDAIAEVSRALGARAQIGVGTVLSSADAEAAIDAGAQFVVTPVLRPKVVATCRTRAVPVLCGALTPSELLAAHELGADLVKLFPARTVGPRYLQDVLAALPQLRLVPTGGVSPENARAYLAAGAVAVGIGGSLVAEQAVAQQDWSQITATARRCVEAIR